MKIVIPTLGRLNDQITLNSLRVLGEHIWLVVRPEEEAGARAIHPQVAVISSPVTNMAETIEWIVKVGFRGEKIWIVDDDCTFVERYNAEIPDKLTCNTVTQSRKPELVHEMWSEIQRLSDIWVHGGLAACNSPLHVNTLPHKTNTRYCTNKWYDLSKIDVDAVDWTACIAAEDFWVMLELYEQGYDWCCITRWGINGKPTNASGGCSTYRTVDMHNASMQVLKNRFPQWVTLREDAVKTGPWAGLNRYKVTISVRRNPRKQEPVITNSLFDFSGDL